MSLSDVKTAVENEIHAVEAKVESVFESAKEEPAKVAEEVKVKVEGAGSAVESTVAADVDAKLKTLETLVAEKFAALEERIASFNKRSNHPL